MTPTMRIYGFEQFGSADVQQFFEVPVPGLDPSTVRIDVTAVGVNPGDIKVRSGQRTASFPAVFPMAMGREAAGIVRETGADAPAGLAVGDRVFGACASGIGALGRQTLLTAESTTRIPDGLDDPDAACIPVAVATAFDAQEELDIGPDDLVLVLGAGGGVGVHAVQLARHVGARVIGVASESKRELVERFGAVHVPSGAGWEDRVRAAATAVLSAAGIETATRSDTGAGPRADGASTGEATRCVDAIVDCVGGEVLAASADLLKPTPGVSAGSADIAVHDTQSEEHDTQSEEHDTQPEEGARTRVRSVADPAGASAVGGSGVTRRRIAEVFEHVADLVARGAVEVVVDRVVPFADSARAVAHVESGHARGKTVIALDDARAE